MSATTKNPELGATAFAAYQARMAAVSAAHPEKPLVGLAVNVDNRGRSTYFCGACGTQLVFRDRWEHP